MVRGVFTVLTLSMIMGCGSAEPVEVSSAKPAIVRDVGQRTDIATRPGKYPGYRVEFTDRQYTPVDVVGSGRVPVSRDYPYPQHWDALLRRSLGPEAFDTTQTAEPAVLSVIVRSLGDVDAVISDVGRFLHANDLSMRVSIQLATDRFLHTSPLGVLRGPNDVPLDIVRPVRTDQGTLDDIKTEPGRYDGYEVRLCSEHGLRGVYGLGANNISDDVASLERWRLSVQRAVERFHVAFGPGCRPGEAGPRVYVSHLSQVDDAVARVGDYLAQTDSAEAVVIVMTSDTRDFGRPERVREPTR